MFSITLKRRLVQPLYRPIRLLHSPSRSPLKSCPSCSQPLSLSLPVCTKCGHISHLPKDTRFHDIFGLPYDPNPFVIDLAVLKQRFRNAQTLCHPDNWAAKGSIKQDVAQTLSARINEAYQCLSNPLSRAEYILERHHIPISERDQVDDIDFMSFVMQARETIEETEEQKQIVILFNEMTSEIKKTERELEGLVGKGQWNDVKSAAVRLRYLQGIQMAAKKRMGSQ